MRSRFVNAVLAVVAGGGLALAQSPGQVSGPAAAPQFTTTYPYPGEYTQSPEATCAGTSFPDRSCPDQCGNAGFYFSADYLLWKMRPTSVPAINLVHSVPFFIPALGGTTNLNFVNSVTLPTGLDLDYPGRSGVRAVAGFWLDEQWAFEGSFFQIERRHAGSAISQTDTLNINTPFFTTFAAGTPPIVTTVPSTLPGTITVNASAEGAPRLFGTELSMRRSLINFGGCFKINALAGLRYVNIDENLNVTDNVNITPTGPLVVGTSIIILPPIGVTTFDHIGTQNQFFGAQVGVQGEACFGKIFIEGTAKFAAGGTAERVNITNLSSFAGGGAQPGGVLTSPLDGGSHSRSQTSVLTELGFNVGYQVNSHLRAYVGYNFLYMPDIVRPGSQVGTASSTTVVNFAGLNTTAGIPQNAFRFQQSDFSAYGIDFGFELRY